MCAYIQTCICHAYRKEKKSSNSVKSTFFFSSGSLGLIFRSFGGLFYFVLGWGDCFCFETGSPCLAQAGLELMILLPQSPEGWDYRSVPQQPVSIVYFELICMCGIRYGSSLFFPIYNQFL